MAQEDGMSVQKSLVSATLRCLQRFITHTHTHKYVVTCQRRLWTEETQWSPSNCFNLHPTSDTER